MNWGKFKNDYLLRTDAVWEKQKLRDYFRLYFKCFYFDKENSNYVLIEPEEITAMIYQACKKSP